MMFARSFRSATLVFVMASLLGAGACSKGGGRRGAGPSRWLEDPESADRDGNKFYFDQLEVQFEIPDTLYVFRDCGEASHSPEGENGWIPVIVCTSTNEAETEGLDEFASEDDYEGNTESVSMTIYATEKTRPLDERTVSWFENQYKQSGFEVDELSYQHDYQNKSGIYAKLQVIDPGSEMPEREIMQFMFPKKDVVFVARTEYKFGDSRAIPADWKYILWNFDIYPSDNEGAAKYDAAKQE